MNSPFDELKYKELLKGLEASEILFSYVKTQTDILRLDSFYYSKEFLSDEIIISKTTNKTLKELNASLLSFGAYSLNNFVEYKDSGIPFVRGLNMKNGVLDFSDTIYIDANAHKLLWKSEVKPNTILLSMSGTIGEVAIAVQEYQYPMNSNQDIAKIRLKRESIRPCYLYAFLRSKYGQNFLKREARGSVQQHVFLSQIETIRIPLLPDSFQLQIEQLVKSAHSNLYQSKALYSDAENMLLSEIGLQDWQPNNNPVNIKPLKESFLATGRLDAEHYQVKYDELETIIRSVPYKIIAEIQKFNARGVQPDYVEEGSVPVVNSKHILEDRLDYENFERTTREFLSSYERAQINYGDILTYTTGANIGRTQVYLQNNPALASNHVNILRVRDVNPIYLALVLNSIVGRLQTEKLYTGSAQAELYPCDIEKFIIPLVNPATQESIAAKIQKSFALKAESKRLLDEAKRMIEKEIEEGTF